MKKLLLIIIIPFLFYACKSTSEKSEDAAEESEAIVTVADATDTQAPTVPEDLTAAPISSTVVGLNWSSATDDVAVAGYRIYRDGACIASVVDTYYDDTGLVALTEYVYTVSAYDASGNESSQSSSVSVATFNSASGGPSPMPVISRDVPAYTAAGSITSLNDDSYYGFCWLSATDLPIWIAYDLSTVPEEQRDVVVVHWINNSSGYFEGVDRAPGVYTIDAHAAAGGTTPPDEDDSGWVTLAEVTEEDINIYRSRQHVVNLTDGETVYNWIRLHIKQLSRDSEYDSLMLNMDVHDAHLGVEDSWFFAGDSITAAGMTTSDQNDDNFAQIISVAMPDYFPAQENAGRGNWRTDEGALYLPEWLNHFPGRYVTVNFGTNDADGIDVEEFYSNYETMIQAVFAAGKIPIIPTIPWCRQSRADANIPALNQELEDLKAAYPQILDGPDFWTYFSEHQDLISDDDLHPNAEGYLAYRRLWAEKMLEVVYNASPEEDDEAPSLPTNLVVSEQGHDSISITWTASSDNVGVAGYRIFRDSVETGTSFTTTYSDTGLEPENSYTYTISAHDVAGNQSAQSEALATSTTAIPAPLTRIEVNGDQLQVGSSVIYLNGANTPWDHHNGTWNNFGGDYDADWWDDHYREFNSNGLNSSRVWITCSGEVGINIDETGYISGATEQHWADLDSFFEIAQERQVYIMATLMSFDHFSDSYTTYQSWRNWINSDVNIDSYINNYLIPFVQRYADNTALWSIDLINEPDWATDTEGGTTDWARFQQYFAKAAKAIHDNSDILVTVGTAVIKYNSDTCGGSMGNMVSDTALRAQLDDAGVYLDFWSPHWYDWMAPYWSTPMYVTPANFDLDDSKPSLIGENPAFGTDGHTLTEDVESAYLNGWAGIQSWSSNEVSDHGGWEEVSTAGNAFIADYSDAVFPPED